MKLEKVKDIHIEPSEEVVALVDQMHAAGGFMGRHLAEVARIYVEMLTDKRVHQVPLLPRRPRRHRDQGRDSRHGKEGMVDVIVTASGRSTTTSRAGGDYYHGSFDIDDVKVKKKGYHRLGNVLVPLDDYGPAIESGSSPGSRPSTQRA